MRVFAILVGLVLLVAACGASPGAVTAPPSLPTIGVAALPSATPLPTGKPVNTGQPTPEPSAGSPLSTPVPPVEAGPASGTPAPAVSPATATRSPDSVVTVPPSLPPPPARMTALALPAPAQQPPPIGQVDGQTVLPLEVLTRLIDDLAARTGSDPAAIALSGAEAVIWNDGSLGCPRPGVLYTQEQVEGYRVVLRVDGREYDYRVGRRGAFVLCERP